MRSGAEHWPHRIAVEVRCGTLASQDRGCGPARNTDHTSSQDETKEKEKAKAEEEEEEEEVKADIKSNNPHLTGGEKILVGWVTKQGMKFPTQVYRDYNKP